MDFDVSLAQEAVRVLKSKGWILATAESCTAGLIGGAITEISGSSAVYDRGFITYSNDAKIQMLEVNAEMIAEHGAVSEDVAKAMAAGALTRSNATLAISVTGIAGPGGSDHKPEGRVCFGLASSTCVEADTIEFGALGRRNVRTATVNHALQIVIDAAERLAI